MINTTHPKLIIVEGLDHTGKTTLIKSLRRRIKNHKVLGLSSANPPNGVDQLWSIQHYRSILQISEKLLHNDWTVITDRFHIGETVYGPLYRNSDTDYIWELEKSYYDNNPDVWLITLVDYGNKIVSRDDGLSNESSGSEYEKTRLGFIESHNKSCIKNKILLNMTDDGWVDPSKILELIYA